MRAYTHKSERRWFESQPLNKVFLLENQEYVFHENWYTTFFGATEWRKNFFKFLQDKIANFRFNAQSQDFQKQKNMHKMDKLARYFPKVENSKSFSRKKLWQNKIGTFHLKHPVFAVFLCPENCQESVNLAKKIFCRFDCCFTLVQYCGCFVV